MSFEQMIVAYSIIGFLFSIYIARELYYEDDCDSGLLPLVAGVVWIILLPLMLISEFYLLVGKIGRKY